MTQSKAYWAYIFSMCLIIQCMIVPAVSAPNPEYHTELESRQTPLAPSQFALAATRFIVMLPFLPLMMAIPGVTGIVMPLFMALQDRLTTIIPNMPNILRPVNNGNNQQGGGGSGSFGNLLSIFGGVGGGNQNNQGTATSSGGSESTNAVPTFFRFKRSLFKLPSPAKALNEGFREVFDFLQKTDDVLDHLTSAQPDCRRQAVCRLHHSFDPNIGTFLGNLLQVLKIDSKVDELEVSDLTKSIIKDILKAANVGLFQRDCSSVYSRCSISVAKRRR